MRCFQAFQLTDEHVGLQLSEEMKTRDIGLENTYAKMIMKTMNMDENDCRGQVE